VAEDYRLTVRLNDPSQAGKLASALRSHRVEEDVRDRFGERIAVSDAGERVFLYADTESAARHAQEIVGQLLSAQDLQGEFELDRWHHAEEEWEDASLPVPSTAAEQLAEHEKLGQQEQAESQTTGIAEWELRIELDSHQDARALAERLTQEGVTRLVRRWKYLVIGSEDEDDARELAERLEPELPAGATISVEPGSGLAWRNMPANPFAVFGGLGG
jgi:hypothetical protein